MSGNVRFCPVCSKLPPLSPSTAFNRTTYSNIRHASDRTYRTFATPVYQKGSGFPAGSAVPPPFCILHSTFCISYANVRKCPVLSGSTVHPRFYATKLATIMTYRENPFCPDQTSTGNRLQTRAQAPITKLARLTPYMARNPLSHQFPRPSPPTPSTTCASAQSPTLRCPAPKAIAFAPVAHPPRVGFSGIPKADLVDSPLVAWSPVFLHQMRWPWPRTPAAVSPLTRCLTDVPIRVRCVRSKTTK